MFVDGMPDQMRKRLVTVGDDAPLIDAAKCLLDPAVRLVVVRRSDGSPVVDRDSHPIGVLNARDALEILLKEAEHDEALLRDYVMCVGYR